MGNSPCCPPATQAADDPKTEDVQPEQKKENVKEKSSQLAGVRLQKVELPPRQLVHRDSPLTLEDWNKHKNADGSFKDVDILLAKIFRSGLSPELRAEAWRYLLGVYEWSRTKAEEDVVRKLKREEYSSLKRQWRLMDDKDSRYNDYCKLKIQIDKDIIRMDRKNPYFKGDDNPNLDKARSILLSYVMLNFDIGYAQSMSFFLAQLLVVIDDECDTFWAIVGFMNKFIGILDMKVQKDQLRSLNEVVNPKLAKYLKTQDADSYDFAARWIQALFRVEFSDSDIVRLWEILWSGLPCKNFHLVLCVAILDKQTDLIVKSNGYDEIYQHMIELSMKIDLDETLRTAESIWNQLNSVREKLPPIIFDILGFQQSMSSSHSAPGPSSQID